VALVILPGLEVVAAPHGVEARLLAARQSSTNCRNGELLIGEDVADLRPDTTDRASSELLVLFLDCMWFYLLVRTGAARCRQITAGRQFFHLASGMVSSILCQETYSRWLGVSYCPVAALSAAKAKRKAASQSARMRRIDCLVHRR